MSRRRCRRTAAVAVEAAIVYSVFFVLLFGLIVGGIGVFRYQQTALLAREGARWASVHGSDWQGGNGNKPAPADDVRTKAILPRAAGIDPARVTVKVQWIDAATGNATDWDSASRQP